MTAWAGDSMGELEAKWLKAWRYLAQFHASITFHMGASKNI